MTRQAGYGVLDAVLGSARPHLDGAGPRPLKDPIGGQPLSRAQRAGLPRRFPPIQEVPLQARRVTVRMDGRLLLEDISFDVAPGEVLALVGPSGAGKSTLVKALTGQVDFDGRISYGALTLTPETAGLVRSVIGFVPQHDVIASPLPLHRALAHVAALRMPNAGAGERRAAIAEVVRPLRLTDRLDTPVNRLSGGERKRAAVAMELLSRASVIVLDEPTTGLDPDAEATLVRMLQELAAYGRRTIVMITHSPAALSMADNVVVLGKTPAGVGRLAFHGPPDEAAAHFGASTTWDYAHVYAQLADPAKGWAGAFTPRLAVFDPDSSAYIPPSTRSWPGLGTAIGRLAARRLEALWWDRRAAAGVVAQTLLLVVLVVLMLRWGNLDPLSRSADPRLLLAFTALAAITPGLLGGAREVVGERDLVARDLAVGMSPIAYVLGRFLALAAIGLVQTVLLLLVFAGQGGRHGVFGSAGLLLLGAWSAAAAGLAISACGGREAGVLALMPGVLVAQILLVGAFLDVEHSVLLAGVAKLSPAYWTFRGVASSQDLAALDVACRTGSDFCSRNWHAGVGAGMPVLFLTGLTLGGLVVAVLALRTRGRLPG